MSRMTDQQEQRRADVEDTLTNIGTSRILIDTQVRLRVKQAIRRDSSLRDLLSPLLVHMTTIDTTLTRSLRILVEEWREHEQNGW